MANISAPGFVATSPRLSISDLLALVTKNPTMRDTTGVTLQDILMYQNVGNVPQFRDAASAVTAAGPRPATPAAGAPHPVRGTRDAIIQAGQMTPGAYVPANVGGQVPAAGNPNMGNGPRAVPQGPPLDVLPPAPAKPAKSAQGAGGAKEAKKKGDSLSKMMRDIEKVGGSLTAGNVVNNPNIKLADVATLRDQLVAKAEEQARAEQDKVVAQVAGATQPTGRPAPPPREGPMDDAPPPAPPEPSFVPQGAMPAMRATAPVPMPAPMPVAQTPAPKEGPGLISKIFSALGQPETQAGLADLALAFSQPTVNAQTGAVLSQPWQARLATMVRNRANDAMLQRALSGEGMSASLPSDMQVKVNEAQDRRNTLGLEYDKLELEKKKEERATTEGAALTDYHRTLIDKMKHDMEKPDPKERPLVAEAYDPKNPNVVIQKWWNPETGKWEELGRGTRPEVLQIEANKVLAEAKANGEKPLTPTQEIAVEEFARNTLASTFYKVAEQANPSIMDALKSPLEANARPGVIYANLPEYEKARWNAMLSTFKGLIASGVAVPDATQYILEQTGPITAHVITREEYDKLPVGAKYMREDGRMYMKLNPAAGKPDPVISLSSQER